MGISGLIPLLREAQRPGHVKEFAGQTVGVDSYIWLYKGAFACASDLALGQPTTKYVSFFMARAHMLRHHGVEPLFVFDGGPLPSKLVTELERQRNRTERRQAAITLWNQQKRKQAFEMFQRCVEVTPLMAKAVIEQLKLEGFRYIVAPYEADAQLAYLDAHGLISAAISEDSDLIVFGCRNIIFKLDQYGEAVVFDRKRMFDAKAVDIQGWSSAQVRRMCILSGCDYVNSVPGVGLKKAHRYVARSHDLPAAVALMRADKLPVPEGYEADVVRADLTFVYQRVYDPRTKAMACVSSSSPSPSSSSVSGGREAEGTPRVPLEDMPFIGPALDPHIAHGIALADLDPVSHLPFDTLKPPQPSTSSTSSTSSLPPAVALLPAKPVPKSAPVGRVRNLQSFWKSPKPSTAVASRPSRAQQQPVDAAAAADPNEVCVKFRNNDQSSELVSTTQQSRFFSATKPPAAVAKDENEDESQPQSLASTQVVEDPGAAAAVADSPLPLPTTHLPAVAESQCSTVVEDSSATSDTVIPAARPHGTGDAHAISLFGQFMYKPDDIPDFARSPVYEKEARIRRHGTSSTAVASAAAAVVTRSRSSLLNRLPTNRTPLLPTIDNLPIDSPAASLPSPLSAKRKPKPAASLIDDVKKFRYLGTSSDTTPLRSRSLLLVAVDHDDIVDSSASDRENLPLAL
ncbi:Rad2 nuclease [Coemansia sp. RSA 2320]|nr:Rad2 nuclease [Coemansia sp. RSA 2320]